MTSTIIVLMLRGMQGRRRSGAVPRRRIERGMKGLIVVERVQVRVATGNGPVLGVERDCAFEVRDRLGMFPTLGVCNGEHVESVIVVRIFVAYEPQVSNRFVVAAPVQGQRG